MSKIRLTKNELKKQKDNLKRFTRYLPTLELKKKQLLLEPSLAVVKSTKQLSSGPTAFHPTKGITVKPITHSITIITTAVLANIISAPNSNISGHPLF